MQGDDARRTDGDSVYDGRPPAAQRHSFQEEGLRERTQDL